MNHKRWLWVLGLSIAGVLDSLYLLLFQTRKIEHLVCPIFGQGCERVASSPAAYPGGIPDAIFGVAGYGLAAVTAAAIPRTSGKVKKSLASAAVGGSIVALGLSAYLTYAQPQKTGAWCFWCLTSAAIAVVMAPLVISGARGILRSE
ncbi:MAG: vitamin K epoxide reductase family protein [Armatimonadetes bacterium]|nr:vitamin K epoxide reductase family protein [Armatimonadota bacterium]